MKSFLIKVAVLIHDRDLHLLQSSLLKRSVRRFNLRWHRRWNTRDRAHERLFRYWLQLSECIAGGLIDKKSNIACRVTC